MFGQYPYYNRYGWGNAVADIVGAITKRNQDNSDRDAILGMYAPPDTPQTPPFVPNTRLNTGVVTTPNMGGIAGAGAVNSGAAPQPNSQVGNINLNPTPAVQPAAQPTTQPVVQPSSWSAMQNNIRSQEYARLRELAKNMSPEALRQYIPQYRQMIEDKVSQAKSDYADQSLTPMQDDIMNDLKSTDSNKPGAIRTLLSKVMKYNTQAAQLGRQPLDMQTIKAIANDDAVTVDKVEIAGPNGVTMIQPVIKRTDGRPMTDANGNQVPYQKLGDPYSAGVSPSARLSADVTMRGQDLSHEVGMAGVAARNAAGGGMSSGDTRQFNAANAIVKQHEAWVQHRKDLTGQMPRDEEDPNWSTVQKANTIVQGFLNGMAGIGGNGGGGNVDYYQGMNDVTALIGSGKFSRPQIEAAVQQKYGDLAPYIIRDAFGQQQPAAVNPYGTGANQALARALGNAPVNEDDLRLNAGDDISNWR